MTSQLPITLDTPASGDPRLRFNPLAQLEVVEQTEDIQHRAARNVVLSYNGAYDVVAEAVQNAIDAAEEAHRTSGQTTTLTVTVDLPNSEIEISDTATGMSQAEAMRYLAPSSTSKARAFAEGQARGHKGVGLTFLAYGFDHFELESKTADEHFVVTLERGRSWVSDRNGSVELPMATVDTRPQETKLTVPGVRVRVRITRRSMPKDLAKTLNNIDYAATVLETRTALGALPAISSDVLKAELVFIPQTGPAVRRELATRYRYPHMAAGVKSFDLGAYLRSPGRPSVPPPEKRGAYEACYWQMTTEELVARVTERGVVPDGDAVTSLDELVELLREHNAGIYVMIGNSMSIRTKIADAWNIPGNKGLHKPSVRVATDGMISTWQREVQLPRMTQNKDRLWLVYSFDNVEPDMGRKEFPAEIQDIIQATEALVAEAIAKEAQPFLKPRRETGNDQRPGTDRVNPHVKAATRRGDPLTHAAVTGHGSVPFGSTPAEEQDVVALFNQLVANGVLGHLVPVYQSGTDEFDGFVDITPDRVSPAVAAVLPGDARLSQRDLEAVLEYKFDGASILDDVINHTKRWADLNLLVCWKLSRAHREAAGQELTFWPADDPVDRVYAGVTHFARTTSGGEHTVPVIVLSDMLAALSDYQP